MKMMLKLGLILCLALLSVEGRPQFDFGSVASNLFGAAVNTAIGRDCKGRPQGDYFFGCQCIGPFNIGRRRREAQNSQTDTRLFINSNQGLGGDFIRCSAASFLNRGAANNNQQQNQNPRNSVNF
eukprot:TRINITY_DN8021_c0_g1_i1.p1 TRINITY_DN8021_c0_g1~~TRINITY_DN8021_c0_g1_i1.p1  ORF type:complete len:125 (+),score=31.04 TRINITY_DN8021_c0_g1_i1:48-422(+)